jgi:hypothetical protein
MSSSMDELPLGCLFVKRFIFTIISQTQRHHFSKICCILQNLNFIVILCLSFCTFSYAPGTKVSSDQEVSHFQMEREREREREEREKERQREAQ